MKTFIHLLIPSILLFFTSCSTTYLSSGGDDVYYTPSKATNGAVANNAGANQAEKGYDVSVGSKPTTDYTTVYSDEQEGTNAYRTTQEPSDSGYEVDGSGNTYITNYYDYDDYYDYAYSSRIRRFHNCYYSGFGYYHNYYTDLYWYNYDPFYYGVSIYYGYPFWYPNYYSYYRPWGWYGWLRLRLRFWLRLWIRLRLWTWRILGRIPPRLLGRLLPWFRERILRLLL
jgi:hypothetical protein